MSRISILTPFRNAERFIRETADSILAQTHSDWEWILVNDHSSENEEKAIGDLLNDPRIRVFQKEGRGIVDALCTAFDQASGEYITRMDADDIMPSFKLQLFLETLKRTNAHIVTGKVRYFTANATISPGYLAYENWLNERVEHTDFYTHIYRECAVASGNWMMRTADLKACGGFSNLNYPEDYDLLFRWYEQHFSIVGIHEVTHLWRDHELRTSKTSDNYQQTAFFNLKVKRFVQLDFNPQFKLILNGTGQKGRLTAKVLIENNVPFLWLSHEPEKFEKGIFGIKILGLQDLPILEKAQLLNSTLFTIAQLISYYKEKVHELEIRDL